MSLLEREQELAVLRSCWRAAAGGSGGVVLVRGVAGAGKTALLEAVRREAAEAGLAVLSATGSELERELGFGVIRQLFERRLLALPDAERAELLTGAASLAAPVVLEPGDGPAQPEATSLHGLYWLAVELAAHAPLLVCVDDAHWADAPSLRALAYLGRRLDGVPLALVVAARDAEPGSDVALLERAFAESAVVRPPALSETAVARWLHAAHGRPPAARFVRECVAVTGGNPLLLRELTAELRAEGLGADAAAAGRIAGVAPAAIGRSVLTRLARLGTDAIAVAEAVAMLSQDARIDRVAAIAGVSVRRASEIADRLIAAGIFAANGFAFAHPLLRTAVYEQIPSVRRGLAHALVAERLLADGGGPERAAGHLLLAPEAGRDWAVRALRSAAAAAIARGAPEAAVRLLRRALAERPDRDYEVLLDLAQAETLTQDPAAAAHATEVATNAATAHQRVRGALAAADALYVQGDGRQVLAVLAATEHDAAGLELAVRQEVAASGLLASALIDCSQLDARLEALGVDALAGDSAPERMLLFLRAMDLAVRAQPHLRVREIARRALAQEDIHRPTHALLPTSAARALARTDLLDEASAVCTAFIDGARSRGSLQDVVQGCFNRAEIEWRAGRLDEAEADAREASEHVPPHHRWVAPAVQATLVDVLLERQPVTSLLDPIAGLREDVERIPPTWARARVLHVCGRVRAGAGDVAGALEDLVACGDVASSWGHFNPADLPWRSDLALALHANGEVASARALVTEELRLARQFGAPGTIGTTLRTRALVSPGEQVVSGLREAEQVLARTPLRLEHARALVDLGAAQRRAGQRGEARETLRAGLDGARRCGAQQLVERARDELTAAGARPRRERLSGPESLTASERRVARLAADGLTNRQIAQALFVTTKTVEMHLAHAYPKLRVKRRGELAAALAGESPG